MTDGVQRRVQPQRQTDAHNLAQGAGIKAAGQNRQRKFCAAAANVKNAAYPRQNSAIAVAAATPPMPRPSAPVSTRSSTMLAAQLINSSSREDELLPMPRKRTGVEVIAHVAQNPQHRDAQIQHRPRHGVRRDLHQLQHPRPQQKPDDGQRQRCCKQQPDRGAHKLLQLVMVAAADRLRYEDGDARADTHKDTEQNFERLGAGRHRCQRRSVAEIADDQRVHRAVQSCRILPAQMGSANSAARPALSRGSYQLVRIFGKPT